MFQSFGVTFGTITGAGLGLMFLFETVPIMQRKIRNWSSDKPKRRRPTNKKRRK